VGRPTRIPGVRYVQGRNDYRDSDGHHYGIAIHNTSNDASDEGEASYAQHRTDGTSATLYVDNDSVTQSIALTDKTGHAGSHEGNENAISVEITGTNGKSRAWWLANVAWDKLGDALGWVICNDPDYANFQVRRASVGEMRSNPKVRAFYSHNDMRLAWGGTVHTDPGDGFPWDRLFAAVNAGIKKAGGKPTNPNPPVPPASPSGTEQIVNALPQLKRGSNGQHVKVAQSLLNVRGYGLSVDGDFGAKTEAAVADCQRKNSISADKIIGPNTYAVLLYVH
jgi:hypothetical protein